MENQVESEETVITGNQEEGSSSLGDYSTGFKSTILNCLESEDNPYNGLGPDVLYYHAMRIRHGIPGQFISHMMSGDLPRAYTQNVGGVKDLLDFYEAHATKDSPAHPGVRIQYLVDSQGLPPTAKDSLILADKLRRYVDPRKQFATRAYIDDTTNNMSVFLLLGLALSLGSRALEAEDQDAPLEPALCHVGYVNNGPSRSPGAEIMKLTKDLLNSLYDNERYKLQSFVVFFASTSADLPMSKTLISKMARSYIRAGYGSNCVSTIMRISPTEQYTKEVWILLRLWTLHNSPLRANIDAETERVKNRITGDECMYTQLIKLKRELEVDKATDVFSG